MAVTRFYEAFHPTHYDIKLDINRQAKQFAGHVTIDGEALTKTISLHQKFLQVTSVTTEGRTLSFETSDEQEALTFTLPKTTSKLWVSDFTYERAQKQRLAWRWGLRFSRGHDWRKRHYWCGGRCR